MSSRTSTLYLESQLNTCSSIFFTGLIASLTTRVGVRLLSFNGLEVTCLIPA